MNLFEYLAHENERSREQMKDPVFQHQLRMMFVVLSALLSALAGAACLAAATDETQTESSGHLWWKTETTSSVPTETRIGLLVAGIALVAIAVALAAVAIRLATRRAALKQYEAILTGVEVITIQQISDITGLSRSRVYKDIRAMLGSGMIDDFYIDYQREQVISRKYIPKTSYKTVVTCSGCGGNNEVIVGVTRTCSFCGQPLALASQ